MRRSAAIFTVIALAQLAVPAWMIRSHERIMREGEVFKFRTAPIDPRDPFRGEYVALNFEAARGSWIAPDTSGLNAEGYAIFDNLTAYASLATDSAGFAFIPELSAEPPVHQAHVTVQYGSANHDKVETVALPFDRYYLEEGDGAKTESMLMPHWEEGIMSQPLPAYAVVRVYQGEAVIEDLIVGHKSIHEWLKEMPSE
ncbi:MAG: GDYXXLXY domain-containing protein [Flavobacteriales bacterium]|nr:GDYXXLXY domain-containing protein [Flavobacteriales bacterium]